MGEAKAVGGGRGGWVEKGRRKGRRRHRIRRIHRGPRWVNTLTEVKLETERVFKRPLGRKAALQARPLNRYGE